MAGANHVDAVDHANGGPLVAAITLGSNSFNMLLARPGGQFPQVIAKHKRKVRLARGLVSGGVLEPQAAQEALDCLQWFGELLQHYQPQHRAVYATAALRQAADGPMFCAQAKPLLGCAIEVISGEREAEYIFHGMRATTATQGRCLMLDIGGASTELVLGDAAIDYKTSLPLGAVLYTERYFAQGLSAQGFAQAQAAAMAALQPHLAQIAQIGWQQAMGISGTFRSVFELAEARGLGINAIELPLLQQLQQELLTEQRAELIGLNSERVPTFAAGLAILQALMIALNITQLHPAGGALREGVLVELNRRYQRMTKPA
ncbi:exopolyphosphatase [uncultured Ferrimonas sp.]|uniref:Ppx/GppA phosphatase family protein n=1 Tax=uncultured Ferrimonas sp. TaxID=432640 RepID=UPI002634C575|nr:exopolyphosphatase [uncultured Ferrimonas sp.]